MNRVTCIIAVMVLSAVSLRASTTPAGYFGPVKVTVARNGELPLPGFDGYDSTVIFDQKVRFFLDQSLHTETCLVMVDPISDPAGHLSQPTFVSVPGQLVYAAIYPTWRLLGGYPFASDSSSTCTALVGTGDCLRISGHYDSVAGVSGLVNVVDSLQSAIGCPGLSLAKRKVSLPPAPAAVNCDGFSYFCGQILPFAGCGCVQAAPGNMSCLKALKDSGSITECRTQNDSVGYCVQP